MESATPSHPRGAPAPAPLFSPLWRRIFGCFFGESANRFNRTAGGKSEVGGIVDNKYFRLNLERSLERCSVTASPKGGRGPQLTKP
jgi:hypothetical protein